MIEWALFYVDGSAFTNEDGGPEEAPREMVQAAAHKDDRTGWTRVDSDIGYWGWRSDLGRWHGLQNESAWQSYLRIEPWPLTVFGWEIDDEEFGKLSHKIEQVMKTPKTSWRRRERRVG
jgi:hypothetical protein